MTVNGVETHQISGKEKVWGAALSKEGQAESVLGHHNWFPWERCNCKDCFLLPTS